MAESQEDRLRGLTDDELRAVVVEIEGRPDQFDQKVRTLVNDELRRRRWPLVGRSGH